MLRNFFSTALLLALTACGESSGRPARDAAFDVSTNPEPLIGQIVVRPSTPLTLVEGGAPSTFEMFFLYAVRGDVTIEISSSDPSAATVTPSTITVRASDWETPRLITIAPTDDEQTDGPQPFQVVIGPTQTADPRYAGMDPDDVDGIVVDDEVADFVVSAPSRMLTEAFSEATFTVRLTQMPEADVHVAVSSSDETEGTVSPTELVFSPTSFAALQTVTVTVVNDDVTDGTVSWNVVLAPAVSSDAAYGGLDPMDVPMTTADDE